MTTPEQTVLPTLRDELQFLDGAADGDGRAGYLIFDPVQNKYFRIGVEAAQGFAAWSRGTVEGVIEAVRERGLNLRADDIAALVQFARSNNLTQAGPGSGAEFVRRHEARRQNVFMWLLHNYLFFKIPLLRPQKFLNATYPYVRWLGARLSIKLIVLLTLIGVYFAGRQVDVFLATFADFANWQGAVLLAVTLVFLKSGHELGHAFVATHYKCQVPVMGIAFMVLFPMLYTDVSDAWRLRNRRQRLMIDAAGMMVELAMGGICLFLWALAPDGPFRTMCFFVATTGWIMSLAVNLSPFMRFDGYHILADGLGVHNLQMRGFAIGKWQLRKIIFGLPDPVPEQFSPHLHRVLVAYAWGTWVYRFFLFLGIALLVYFFAFKLLGIVLFLVEIIWFIGLPVFREVVMWWQRRGDIIRQRRAMVSFFVLGTIIGLLVLPIQKNIAVPAVLAAKQERQHFSPAAAKIEQVLVRTGSLVKPGDVLVRLSSPEYVEAQTTARLKLKLVRQRLGRGMASAEEKALRQVLQREEKALVAELAGLVAKMDDLVLHADISGVVTDVAPGLAPGLWVNQDVRLVQVVAKNDQFIVQGLVDERNVGRLSAGAEGVFVSENTRPVKLPVVVERIGLANGGNNRAGRELKYLSALNGGPVAMDQGSRGTVRTSAAVYPVRFTVVEGRNRAWLHEQRGTVVVAAKAESVSGRFFRNALSVLVREAGF